MAPVWRLLILIPIHIQFHMKLRANANIVWHRRSRAPPRSRRDDRADRRTEPRRAGGQTERIGWLLGITGTKRTDPRLHCTATFPLISFYCCPCGPLEAGRRGGAAGVAGMSSASTLGSAGLRVGSLCLRLIPGHAARSGTPVRTIAHTSSCSDKFGGNLFFFVHLKN